MTSPNAKGLSVKLTDLCLLPQGREKQTLTVDQGQFHQNRSSPMPEIALDSCIAFPGLLNAHDHLHFNLYPQLGTPPYRDYIQWGLDIQKAHAEDIRQIEAIPVEQRVIWGEAKNLMAGVTRVVDHSLPSTCTHALPTVSTFHYLHSLAFHPRWRLQMLKRWGGDPIILHLAEGTSRGMRDEFARLQRWNIWQRKIIAVHGVGLNSEELGKLHGLVWCPVSNRFLYGQTLNPSVLASRCAFLLGTDSSLSADPDWWNHIRVAMDEGLPFQTLFNILTQTASRVLGLEERSLTAGNQADLVIARRKHAEPKDAFRALTLDDILLVLIAGKPVVVDDSLYAETAIAPHCDDLFSVHLSSGAIKWVPWDLHASQRAIAASKAPVQFPISLAPR